LPFIAGRRNDRSHESDRDQVEGISVPVSWPLAATLLLCLHPEWRVALLLGVAIWSFSRFYYFAFYVIEKYVDSSYRFAGLPSFARYLIAERRRSETSRPNSL